MKINPEVESLLQRKEELKADLAVSENLEVFNQIKTWGLKKKLAPKNVIDSLPAAKKNSEGVLITGRKELKDLYLETYKARLAPNDISEDLVELKKLKEYLFSLRKRLAETERSKDWTLEQLEKVLENL